MSVTDPNTKTDDTPLRYRVDDLLVDVGRRCVTRDGVELDVTGRSFELLLALIRAAPNAVSLDQLMSEVWRGMVVNNDTVTQRVKMLRQALGDQPEQPRYIANVRGHGYRLLSPVVPITAEAASPAHEGGNLPDGSAHVDAEAANAGHSHTPGYIPLAAGVIVLLALIAIGVGWFIQKNTAPAINRDSVAVLPFANMTGDASKEYLADGMAEELINTLTKVSGLKVPARTSTFAYKGRDTDIRQIAKDLGVGTILQGSVRAAGKRLRITAQLINAQDGLHLWSESYDEEFTDIFKLQDKLATQIAQALQPNLNGVAVESVTQAPPTQDVEAYNLYLQGVSLVQRNSPQNVARAIDYFQKAIDRDPKFARAYAMIAEAQMGWAGFEQSSEHYAAAERAARQALALDPNLANAHNALMGIAGLHGQALEAEAHSRAAVALAPNDGFTRVLRASTLYYEAGRLRQALQEGQKAYALAPANPFVVAMFAHHQALAGRDAEALKYAQAARDLGYPQDSLAGVYAMTALHAASYPEALTSFSKVLHAADPEQARTLEVARLVFAALQDPAKKDAAIAARTRLYPGIAHPASNAVSLQDVSPCLRSALLYGLLRAIDTAYELADYCFSQMVPGALIFNNSFFFDWWMPELRAFRADSRFQGFITRFGLMEYYQQYGPPDDCELKNNKLTCH